MEPSLVGTQIVVYGLKWRQSRIYTVCSGSARFNYFLWFTERYIHKELGACFYTIIQFFKLHLSNSIPPD